MKGLTTAEIIGIILAVIAVVIAIYIMWVKGWIPFLGPVDESTCKTRIIDACNEKIKWNKVDLRCSKYLPSKVQDDLAPCIEDSETNKQQCDNICNSLY